MRAVTSDSDLVTLFTFRKKERKKTDNPREGWEDGTPPPHRDFKEGRVWCSHPSRVSEYS